MPDLRSFAIDKNGLRDAGAQHLITSLPSCTSLTLLSISGNFLSAEKEKALRQAVAGNPAQGGRGEGLCAARQSEPGPYCPISFAL